MADKVIISNKTALTNLYDGKATDVINAVNQLIKADEKKGVKSRLIFIDDEKQMAEFDSKPVTKFNDDKQNKDAVDAVYNKIEPEFILLLGGPDIIPHQQLDSPMADQLKELYHTEYFKVDDFPCDILKIPSDLPYASETTYRNTIAEYLKEYKEEGLNSKSRYVGRLAGITGESDPTALLIAIETAIAVTPQAKSNFNDYFSINTVSPKTDYAKNILKDIFNNAKELHLSPPSDSSTWTDEQLKAPVQLFVCHGTPNIPYWYGEIDKEDEHEFAIALEPKNLNNNVTQNTIVASLCCYGGQLYDPKEKLKEKYVNFLNNIGMQVNEKPQLSICNTYMQNKAAAFVGSTYFSSDSTILEYFLENVMQGKTSGEAIFDARHQYVQDNPEHMELDFLQATLAEFILLGDPSAQLIINEEEQNKPEERKVRKEKAIIKTGEVLKDANAAKYDKNAKPNKEAQKHIDKLAQEYELENVEVKTYRHEDDESKITHVVTGVKNKHKKKLMPKINTHVVTEKEGKIETKKSLFGH